MSNLGTPNIAFVQVEPICSELAPNEILKLFTFKFIYLHLNGPKPKL